MKPRSASDPPEGNETYGPALDKACRGLATLKPREAAWRSGATYEELTARTANLPSTDGYIHSGCDGQFEVRFWGKDYLIHHPQGSVQEEGTGKEPAVVIQIILLHYLTNADGTPPANEWISFRQLPGGRGYDSAFQRRVNLRLAKAFEDDARGLIAAAEAVGGERLTYGDASFLFRILPRLWIAVVFYHGDEEFPASANVLFDGAAEHYLPTEDLAVLGDLLVSRLLKGPGRRREQAVVSR